MSRTASSISLSRSSLTRRGLLGALGLGLVSAGLAGCGFRPVYAPSANGAAGPAQSELAAIYVGLIADRPGQLLRQALQSRFERDASGMARRYDLTVGFEIDGDGIAVQKNNIATRIRLTGRADFTLRAQDATRAVLFSGNARATDNINVFQEQYFAADLNTEAARQRIAEAVADQITIQLAAYFNRKAAGAAS